MPKGTGRPYARPARKAVKKPKASRTGRDLSMLVGESSRQNMRKKGTSNMFNPSGSGFMKRGSADVDVLKRDRLKIKHKKKR